MHGNLRTQKVILGHRVGKVQDNRVLKEKGLIKCEAWGHIGFEAREAQGTWNTGARRARGTCDTRARMTREHVWHERTWGLRYVGHESM